MAKGKKKNMHSQYDEGYNAFKKGVLPRSCPYLNEYGDNSEDILHWMKGWSDSFNDYLGNFN